MNGLEDIDTALSKFEYYFHCDTISEDFNDPLFSYKGTIYHPGNIVNGGFGLDKEKFKPIAGKLELLAEKLEQLQYDYDEIKTEFDIIMRAETIKRREKYPEVVKAVKSYLMTGSNVELRKIEATL